MSLNFASCSITEQAILIYFLKRQTFSEFVTRMASVKNVAKFVYAPLKDFRAIQSGGGNTYQLWRLLLRFIGEQVSGKNFSSRGSFVAMLNLDFFNN